VTGGGGADRRGKRDLASGKRGAGSRGSKTEPGRRPGAGGARGGAARQPGGSLASMIEQALAKVLAFDAPADSVLRRFFAAHPEMGRRDRAELAERVFDVLRNRRLYAHLAQSGAGPMEARLVAISQRSLDIDASAIAPAIRYSLPDWLYTRLAQRLPQDVLGALAAAMLRPAALDLRVNLLKADRDTALARLREEGIDCEPSGLAPTGIRVRGKPALERTLAFTEGLVEVQDCGSQLVAELVAPRRGQTVIDFCAGAGGKTLALAALLRGSGQVFACDVSTARLQRLRPRLSRSGASNVQPFGIDNEGDPKLARLAGRADAVLVDAPCSGTGTLRRNPDLKWRLDETAIAELVDKQRSILAAAARLVRVGGALVYATCSLLDEENQEIRRWFEDTHPGWEVDPAAPLLERRGALPTPLLDPECLVLRPDTHDSDAFFAVRWLRRS
jgi:16S rRNA (cytosine967-C5)-methyltransferase